MTKRASLLVLSLLLVLPHLVHAESQQEIPAEKTAETQPAQKTESAGNHYLEQVRGAIGPLFTPSKENPLYNEWLKAKIEFDLKAVDSASTFNEGNHPISIGAGLRYRYTVEPAYIRNYHHRFDRYVLNANIGTSLVENVGIGAGVNATLTFARVYEDKFQALKAYPYFPNRAPWSADRALLYLLPGEMTRLEMSLSANIGTGKSEDYGHGAIANAGIGLGGGSNLILDVYRMKEDKIRLRIVGARTNGNISLSAGIGLTKAIDFGVDIINRLTKGSIKVNPLSIGTTFNPIHALPMDTMMVDYIFDLRNEESKTAYNEVLSQVYYMKFAKYLNFILNEKTLGDRMLEQVKAAEDLYLKYKDQPIGVRPVDRIFKGRTATNFWSTYAHTNIRFLTNLLSNNYNMYSSRSLVRGFDRDDEPVDLIYMVNNKNSDFSAIKSFFRTSSLDGLQGLFLGKRKETEKTIEVVPTSVSDLIFNRNLEDATLSDKQIAKMKFYLQSSAGPAVDGIDWTAIEQAKSKTNGYIRSQIVFHQDILTVLSGKVAFTQIYTKLRELVDQHPYKDYLPVTFNSQSMSGDQAQLFDKHEEDIRYMSYRLHTILNDPSPEKKLEAYGELRILNLFNEIGAAFITSVLPADKVKDLVFVRVNAGSAAGSLITHVSGKEDVSQLYSSLQFMLAVINDRSFDFRVQLDGNNLQIFKMKGGDAAQVCANCDTTSTTVEKLPTTSSETESKN